MRIYDNAPESYYEELKSYFPAWYADVREMDAIWKVTGKMLTQAKNDIISMLDQAFITRCNMDTIADLENFFEIEFTSPRSDENRRRFLMALYAGFGHCSATKIKDVIRQYTGSEATVRFVPTDAEGNHTLYIDADRGDLETLYVADVRYILDKLIPAHIPNSLLIANRTNISSQVTISRCVYSHAQCGLTPQTATLGRDLSFGIDQRTGQESDIFHYAQADETAVSGLHPEVATLGRDMSVGIAENTASEAFVVEYAQASENAVCGACAASEPLE